MSPIVGNQDEEFRTEDGAERFEHDFYGMTVDEILNSGYTLEELEASGYLDPSRLEIDDENQTISYEGEEDSIIDKIGEKTFQLLAHQGAVEEGIEDYDEFRKNFGDYKVIP